METILIIGLFCLLATTCRASCNLLDRDSLLSFSNSITITGSRSSSPLNWTVSVDCCTWEGVSCDIYGRVSSLKLPSRGLLGSVSPSIANLSFLSQLNLSRNSLMGSFFDGFFVSLSHVQIIDLSHNLLSGQFPSSDMISPTVKFLDFSGNHFDGTIPPVFLKQAINLVSFNISYNNLYGSIPWFLCGISPSIRVLDFSNNYFSGFIPQDVRDCTKLETLRAGFNSLSGPLPPYIYSLSNLRELYFPSNKLSGSLSNDIASLNNLKILALYGNDLTGVIPPVIGILSNLEHLVLHVNNLNGTLPSSLTNCSRLAVINLRVNSLTGDLAKFDFSKFIHLRLIDLGNNLFNGGLPTSLFTSKSLTAVRLATNYLTGEIPANIMVLRSLSFLSISNNSLTNVTAAIRILSRCRNLKTILLSKNFYNEALPDDDYSLLDSQGFQNLQVLGLGGCRFIGQIPSWLANLPKLKVLDLSHNFLTGSIPSLFGSLPNLFYLDLSLNQLSGSFPAELARMPRLVSQQAADQVDQTYLELPVLVKPTSVSNLQYNQLSSFPPAIYLSSNNLNGSIPMEIGQLKFIHVLDLSDNHFSGGIPHTISYLSNLERLDLSKNHFSGKIPSSFINLHFLSFFNVTENDLEGPIPSGGQFDTFPGASFEGNLDLCGRIIQRPCGSHSGINKVRSAKRKLPKEKIIFGLYVGVCFGAGFIISTLAMRNYQIEGSFLHPILKKLMKLHRRLL